MRNEPEWIEREKTSKGGWTRATLEAHGVPWPPPRGWRRLQTGFIVKTSDRHKAYNAYINSHEWKALRKRCLDRSGNKCEECQADSAPGYPLHVHHLTYERFTQELISDLKVLCVDCHNATHGRKKRKPRYLSRDQWFEQREMDEAFLQRVATD